jgi:4-amino-4-deoxy-L-arabinose transferase-like glycosyltransferase
MQDSKHAVSPPPHIDATGQDATDRATVLWQRVVLGLIILLAAFFNLFRLGQNRFADINTSVNPYYAAAVKSMLMSWHNFFFLAFDPAGFLAIDKPPLGFWVQAASARIFGFSAWSLLLPEALAGIGSIVVLYILVRRSFGPTAGLLAALALALMPISVVTNRNNTIDSLLVLTLLLATWALSIAVETGRLRWLLLSALLVGLGFNIKMLEAYVVLPAFVVAYLLCAPRSWSVRLGHLVLAGLVLCVVSFSWITAVDMVPAAQRPYVSSTQTDSELELALGYNGLSRITGISSGSSSQHSQAGGAQAIVSPTTLLVIFGLANTGFPGPLRLVGPLLGGQIGWLLFFAICGLVAVWRWRWPRPPLSSRQQGLVLWSVWFVTLFVFFSVAFFDHPYYMVTFAPAICALLGIGGMQMYRAYRMRTGWRSWLLPIALIGTALTQAYILAVFPAWRARLTPFIVGLSLLLAILLIGARLLPRFSRRMLAAPVFTIGMLVLLIAPTIWAALPLWQGDDTVNPVAGPALPANSLIILAHLFIPEISHAQPELTSYLLAHQGQARYLVAAVNASTAAPFILDTGKPALALGGFEGFDQIVTVQQVASMVRQREVRFFLLPSFAHMPLNNLSPLVRKGLQSFIQLYNSDGSTSVMQSSIAHWVAANCTPVPRAVAEPGISGPNDTVDLGSSITLPTQLFDCARASA